MRRTQYSNLFAFLLGLLLAPAGLRADAGPGGTLRDYLTARFRGDIPAAEKLWDSDDLRRSQALGTNYTGLEARFDDNLLWSAAERTALPGLRPTFCDSSLETGWARYRVVLQAATPDTLVYCVRDTGTGWRVTTPYNKVTAGWTTREGRYVRVHASKLRLLNGDAMQTLDTGIQAIFTRLATPEQASLRLERMKIEYYLCDTEADRRALGVAADASSYRLAGERVVTRSIVDLAAVGRIVVHLTLKETPPRAAAVLEAGASAALGGWQDQSASVVVQAGTALAAKRRADLESVLDARSLQKIKPDVAIPLSACWADVLLRELGPEKFAALYRTLSATSTKAAALPATTVRAEFEKATGKRGPALLDWVRDRAATVTPPLAGGCVQVPEESRTLQPILRWRDHDERWALEVYETGEDYTFLFSPYRGPMPKWAQHMIDSLATLRGEKPAVKPVTEPVRPPGDPPRIAVLIRERLTLEAEAYESALFHTHFSRRHYAGELFGMIIDPDEARAYDYRRDVVVGVRSEATTLPSQPIYYDEKAGRLCFRMRRDILPKPLGEYVALVIPYTGE